MSNNVESNIQGEEENSIRVVINKKDTITHTYTRYKDYSESSDDHRSGWKQNTEIQRLKIPQVWSMEQKFKLVLCVKEQGASWKSICPKNTGKSEVETIKNYLKIVRAAIANLNSKIRAKSDVQINCKQIYKIVKYLCEGKGGEGEDLCDSKCRQVLSRFLLAYLNEQIKENQTYYNKMVEQILEIIMVFKKKQKVKRMNKVKIGMSLVVSEKEEMSIESGYLSDSSSKYEDASNNSILDLPLQNDQQNYLERQQYNSQVQQQEVIWATRGPVIVAQEESQIKAILLEAGLLHVQNSPIHDSRFDQMQNSKWLMRADEFENNNFGCLSDDMHHFYQQNELEGNCYWKINLFNEREQN